MAKEKAARKAHDKEARKQRKQERRSEMGEMMAAMAPEEREETRKRHLATRRERTKDAAAQREALARSVKDGAELVIDLDFDGKMSDAELRHLCQQLTYSYSVNRKAPHPCHLHLLGMKGDVKDMAERQITGLPHWHVTRSEATFDEHFAHKKDKLVYLTADSTTELEDIDPSHVYIIGGLVDHNRYKDLCLQRAEAAGVSTARLPIRKYVNLDSRAVLTVNHVVEIMVQMLSRRGEWAAVLDEVLPARKRAGWREAKAGAKRHCAHGRSGGGGVGEGEGGREGGGGGGGGGGGEGGEEGGGRDEDASGGGEGGASGDGSFGGGASCGSGGSSGSGGGDSGGGDGKSDDGDDARGGSAGRNGGGGGHGSDGNDIGGGGSDRGGGGSHV